MKISDNQKKNNLFKHTANQNTDLKYFIAAVMLDCNNFQTI